MTLNRALPARFFGGIIFNMTVPEKFLKPYDSQSVEDDIYKMWEDSGYFNPDVCIKKGVTNADAEHFSIVLPPPNVTGTLHMGHASMLTVEDILVRAARMQGKQALWVPGTDSAAIATQTKVEKELKKNEGKTRHDIGREELLQRIEAFTDESKATILSQVRRMGSSLDWSRYAYTMDTERYHAVMVAFVRMYEAGLIYRGNRIVNWDPKGQTTISDDEIVYEPRKATLYTFKYSKDFPIAISTTRPETKVGDTAVAVHPDDERYKSLIGKEYEFVFCDVPVKVTIVADRHVDKDFGTGALGVTPAHSHADWEIADRHNLPRPQVINEYAKMTVEGRLKDTKASEARELVADWLRTEGLMESEEEIDQNISTAERTGGIVEPLPKLQWFVDVNKPFPLNHSEIDGIQSGAETTLKEIMRTTVENGQINVMPERFSKTYFHWIDNLRDWCISRQIWFGHRIPVWYRGDEMHVGLDAPQGDGWEQDPDVLDTWFSSALWTFSTLGWPDKTEDLKRFHPTTVLETGYDILFFWVARMVLMSGFFLGQVPFKNVYLHGLVRDEKGRKISKSLGNVLDPVDLIDKYGADATRLSLTIGAAVGNDLKLSEQKIKGYKHFANKIWNITRFILTSVAGADLATQPALTEADSAHIARLDEVTTHITEHIDKFRIDLAADAAYHYVWHELADVIIEESKPILAGDDAAAKLSRQWTLYHMLTTSLKLLHPFMPFVTEEIWQSLPETDSDMLMVAPWPVLE